MSAVSIENKNHYVEDIGQSAAGAVVGIGLQIRERKYFIHLFGDYSFMKLKSFGKVGVQGGDAELGGLILGGGIGCRF